MVGNIKFENLLKDFDLIIIIKDCIEFIIMEEMF